MIKYMIAISIIAISFSSYAEVTTSESKPKKGFNYKKHKKKNIHAQRIYNKGGLCRGAL